MVKVVSTEQEWASARSASASGTLVAEFFSPACGACQKAAPGFESLAQQVTGVNFVKIDLAAVPQLGASEHIPAMPTFRVYKGGSMLTELVGAAPNILDQLKQAIGA